MKRLLYCFVICYFSGLLLIIFSIASISTVLSFFSSNENTFFTRIVHVISLIKFFRFLSFPKGVIMATSEITCKPNEQPSDEILLTASLIFFPVSDFS